MYSVSIGGGVIKTLLPGPQNKRKIRSQPISTVGSTKSTCSPIFLCQRLCQCRGWEARALRWHSFRALGLADLRILDRLLRKRTAVLWTITVSYFVPSLPVKARRGTARGRRPARTSTWCGPRRTVPAWLEVSDKMEVRECLTVHPSSGCRAPGFSAMLVVGSQKE